MVLEAVNAEYTFLRVPVFDERRNLERYDDVAPRNVRRRDHLTFRKAVSSFR